LSMLRRLTPLVAAAVGVVAALLVVTDSNAAVRPFVVLPFLLAGPGLALVSLLDLDEPLEEVVLAIALSVSLDVLVALVMLYGRFWSPAAGVGFLAGVTVLACALRVLRLRVRRDGRTRTPPSGWVED
jgi:uncharacterized membrane protein